MTDIIISGMPANLPAEARAKWIKYLEARTKEEKLAALQEYLSAIPKHKGTENLVKQVRRKIAKLKAEIEEERTRRRRGRGAPGVAVEKEGDVQLVLVGFTNSGRSSILSMLTRARVRVDPRPVATSIPVPGMMDYGGVLIQLVEAPPLIEGADRWNSKIFLLVRNADGVLVVLDASADPASQFVRIKRMLEGAGILLGRPKFKVEVKRGPYPQPQVIINGTLLDGTPDDVRRMLIDYGFSNVRIVVSGVARLEDVERSVTGYYIYKPAIVLLNKAEHLGKDTLKAVREVVGGLPLLPVSAARRRGFEELGSLILRELELIRVYTKEPGEPNPSKRPLVLRRGATVMDVAERIHRMFVKRFRYARVWGRSVKFQGSKVGLDHVLEDGDIVEIRTR